MENKPHAVSVAPRHDAEAIILDLANPIPPGRRFIGRAGQAWLDEVGKRTGTRTRQHTVKLTPLAAESESDQRPHRRGQYGGGAGDMV